MPEKTQYMQNTKSESTLIKESKKIELHRRFWEGKGPSLIFIPSSQMPQYDIDNYESRFHNPQEMWEAEMVRAKPVLEWPTDGIPTVRPNLGTIYIPAIAGQSFTLQEGQMPWPGEPLSLEKIGSIKDLDTENSEMIRRVHEFYNLHKENSKGKVYAYLPDTQGIFDILYILRGNGLFYDLADRKEDILMHLERITDIYIEVSRANKQALGESFIEMVHGHGTQQGLYFPHAGVRLVEDTATLVSPEMIDDFVLPFMKKAAESFGGAFVHFCGKHEYLYEQILRQDFVKAIELGNPEMYYTQWLLDMCAQTETVFYGKLAAEVNEDWQDYIQRIAGVVKSSGVRCVLRPAIFPEDKQQCSEMQQMWHDMTS